MILLVFKIAVLLSIIFLAIINNILVIISVILYRKLRHVNNYFLVSLAFADLFVAMFAMTFNATLEISGIMLSWPPAIIVLWLWRKLFVTYCMQLSKRFRDDIKRAETHLNTWTKFKYGWKDKNAHVWESEADGILTPVKSFNLIFISEWNTKTSKSHATGVKKGIWWYN